MVGRRTSPRALAALLATGLVLAVGCGDDEDEGAEQPVETSTATTTEDAGGEEAVFDTDPCTLLTGADVKALLGKSVEGELQVEGNAATQQPGQCLWETGEPVDLTAPNDRPFSVSVSAGNRLWYDNNVSLVEEDKSFEELAGIADAAFAGDTRGGFLAGDAGVTAELGISSAPSSHDVAVDALERVYANYEG